ncbi:MAG: hypothetical protein IJA32_14685 [Lachnospiraceae bacterium]|nr:hypothetical protein [Lachnospiraceae bacterium]
MKSKKHSRNKKSQEGYLYRFYTGIVNHQNQILLGFFILFIILAVKPRSFSFEDVTPISPT